ncbi:MAG: metal-dependent hydrolase [Salinirussus sp.]
MPSTIVHLAFAGMIAAALLGAAFDRRALLVVLALTALPDFDAFIALISTAGHRTALHTLVLPGLLGLAILVDTRFRSRSWIRERYDDAGVRVGWVAVTCLAVAGIGLDLFSAGGANPLWPLIDQHYVIDGTLELSSQRGIVQTFVDLSTESGVPAPATSLGNSSEVTITTGIDPGPSPEDEPVDRVFPIVRAGWQLLILLVGTGVTTAALYFDGDT